MQASCFFSLMPVGSTLHVKKLCLTLSQPWSQISFKNTSCSLCRSPECQTGCVKGVCLGLFLKTKLWLPFCSTHHCNTNGGSEEHPGKAPEAQRPRCRHVMCIATEFHVPVWQGIYFTVTHQDTHCLTGEIFTEKHHIYQLLVFLGLRGQAEVYVWENQKARTVLKFSLRSQDIVFSLLETLSSSAEDTL